MDLNPDW